MKKVILYLILATVSGVIIFITTNHLSLTILSILFYFSAWVIRFHEIIPVMILFKLTSLVAKQSMITDSLHINTFIVSITLSYFVGYIIARWWLFNDKF